MSYWLSIKVQNFLSISILYSKSQNGTMVNSFAFDRISNYFELSFKLSLNYVTSSSVKWSLHYFFGLVTNLSYQKFACLILPYLILYLFLFWTFHCFSTHRFLHFSDLSFSAIDIHFNLCFCSYKTLLMFNFIIFCKALLIFVDSSISGLQFPNLWYMWHDFLYAHAIVNTYTLLVKKIKNIIIQCWLFCMQNICCSYITRGCHRILNLTRRVDLSKRSTEISRAWFDSEFRLLWKICLLQYFDYLLFSGKCQIRVISYNLYVLSVISIKFDFRCRNLYFWYCNLKNNGFLILDIHKFSQK